MAAEDIFEVVGVFIILLAFASILPQFFQMIGEHEIPLVNESEIISLRKKNRKKNQTMMGRNKNDF